ncbi:hypothetical protein [Proteus sp. G2674]|uniref:hypothetical protein n=1 Tax=Proteus sp. G2674 TaxID=2698886 RepID=UPI00137888E1|nr:hypothetical protein [Proteus sp. G2674]NBL81482.1 hypothetical protein [Proteus sp. G2674]
MNTVNDLQNTLKPIIEIILTLNNYSLIIAIITIVYFDKKKLIHRIAFSYSGFGLVFYFFSHFFVYDEILIDINNTPPFALTMMNIGMLTVLVYLIYWAGSLFGLIKDDKE